MLASVPKGREAFHITCVLDKLHSGKSYIALSHEFNANEPTVYIKEGMYKQNRA